MTEAELKRKLRSLRRLEHSSGASPVFDRYFSLASGTRCIYPFAVLLVFDRPSRARAFREYLAELYLERRGLAPGRGWADEFFSLLDLPPDADETTVRQAFRTSAKQLHPDTGGQEEEMVRLLDLYRNWRLR